MATTYGRIPMALVRGEGMRVWDADGKMYYDFLAGLGVNNLGHCHPRVVEAIRQQAGTLLHVSNLYHIQPQIELADMLAHYSFADRSFFCNSGTESCEAAIKLARKYSMIVSVTAATRSSPLRTPSTVAPWLSLGHGANQVSQGL